LSVVPSSPPANIMSAEANLLVTISLFNIQDMTPLLHYES
jgi:hypothetical protein